MNNNFTDAEAIEAELAQLSELNEVHFEPKKFFETIGTAVNSTNISRTAFLEYMHETMAPVSLFFARYKCAIMEIETKFNVLNTQLSLKYDANPIESIKSRIKSFESIIGKVERNNYEPSLKALEKNMNDIAGIRVVCSFIDDIYSLANSFLSQDDITLIEMKDYIKNPKPSGYRSLHLIVSVPIFLFDEKRDVKVEVQLRTIAMDFWASLEHKLRYKKNIPAELVDSLANELVQCANDSASLDERMLNIRKQINKCK